MPVFGTIEMIGEEEVVAYLKANPGPPLDGLRKTKKKTHSLYSIQRPGWDENRAPSE